MLRAAGVTVIAGGVTVANANANAGVATGVAITVTTTVTALNSCSRKSENAPPAGWRG
ncbi:MAG: hypothetical protein OXU71_04460 [Gammaproteobacteria bacterium]|nr:hypothetical protein [Gammaproteobacteria bacterium]